MKSSGVGGWAHKAIAIVAFGALAAGCAPPAKVVTKISSARDQIKLLYVQGDTQGVLKCQVGADGALSRCRDMAIQLDE